MAKYMTISIREEVADDGSSENSWTDSLAYQEVFHVRWGWLAYPVALVLVSLIFLFVTMYLSRDEEVWKSSALAMMFHSFNDSDYQAFHQAGYDLDDARAMKKFTTHRKVQLRSDSGRLLFKAGGNTSVYGKRHESEQLGASGIAQGIGAAAKFVDGMD